MTHQSIEEIAGSLSKAQVETLLDGRECVRAYRPAQKLVALGLWDGTGDEYAIYPSPTDRGLAVRNHLLSKEGRG